MIKSILKSFLNLFDYNISRKSLYDKSDDPIYILQFLLKSFHVREIIDGGASIGTFSQRLSESFPSSKIHAFEPFQKHFDQLQEIAQKNNSILPVKKCLSNNNNKKLFFLNQEAGTNSLLQSTKQGQTVYGNQLKQIGQTEVECTSIDHYLHSKKIESVDLLKLDLQGGEYNAIQGASESLSQGKIKSILCEILFENHYEDQVSAGKLLKVLIDDYNFIFFNFYQSNYYNGKLIFADVLLFHPSIIEEVKRKNKSLFLPYSNIINYH